MHESSKMTGATNEALDARRSIFDLLSNYDATREETERNLALFLRGSLLARVLATSEIYENIIEIPGSIFDLGTWRGQTAVLCENFRAIFEPCNINRRIICFDTFEGYKGFGENDRPSDLHNDGKYQVGGKAYSKLLEEIIILHEKSNISGHINGKHKVIQGDCRIQLPKFLTEHKNEVVACAFFDLNSYIPTKEAFDLVWNRLVPNGIMAFWQLTRNELPAEGQVYNEFLLENKPHLLKKSKYYPSLCYLQKI